VVVAVQRLQTLVRAEVPQLDGHVGAAARHQLPLLVQADVLQTVGQLSAVYIITSPIVMIMAERSHISESNSQTGYNQL
jgi:hypothetical protein